MLDYWEDEKKRNEASSYSLYLRAEALSDSSQESDVALRTKMLSRARALATKAGRIDLALRGWDEASGFLSSLMAWGRLVWHTGYFVPESARAYYRQCYCADTAQVLKGLQVSDMTKMQYRASVVGDERVGKYVGAGNKMGKWLEKPVNTETASVTSSSNPPPSPQSQGSTVSAAQSVMRWNENNKKGNKRVVAKQEREALQCPSEEQMKSLRGVMKLLSPITQAVQEGISSLDAFNGLLVLTAGFANKMDTHANLLDPNRLRGERGLIAWSAEHTSGPLLQDFKAFAKELESLQKQIEHAVKPYVEGMQDKARFDEAMKALVSVKRGLPEQMSQGDKALLLGCESLLLARKKELRLPSVQICLDKLSTYFEGAVSEVKSDSFKRLTVTEGLAWLDSHRALVRAMMDHAELDEQEREEMDKGLLIYKDGLKNAMDGWFGALINRWNQKESKDVQSELAGMNERAMRINGMEAFEKEVRLFFSADRKAGDGLF